MSEEKNNEQAKKKVDYDFAAHERPLIEAWQNNG